MKLDPTIVNILENAKATGRSALTEPEGLRLLEALGFRVPESRVILDSRELTGELLASFKGSRVVIKAVSQNLPHKSDIGAIAVVENTIEAVREAIETMAVALQGREIDGFSLNEWIEYDRATGGELLLGVRWTDDFGPVVAIGPGGVHAEILSRASSDGSGVLMMSPERLDAKELERSLAGKPILRIATGRERNLDPRVEAQTLAELAERLGQLALEAMPDHLSEIEINPLALTDSGPVALDCLAVLGCPAVEPLRGRPVKKLRNLLEPRSIAMVGVSKRANPGRVMLDNTLNDGFDPGKIFIVKPGATSIAGCACVPDIASLPDNIDLLVLAVSARQSPGLIDEAIASGRVQSILLIPGGLGEREGSANLSGEIRSALDRSRSRDDLGPVVNGGNCLGIRSVPGNYNTLFLPEHRLPLDRRNASPVALVSQSGALVAARLSALGAIQPRYVVSIGNQIDLTIGDYLDYLKDDEAVKVFACYVEGFRPLDGRRWLEAARQIVDGGRSVILYRAGRTPTGAQATASHTASIAGDYAVTSELARQAGVVVAETLADFEDLVRLFGLLGDRRPGGRRLGAISNAGFECVAFADNASSFRFEPLKPGTVSRIAGLLKDTGLGEIVDIHNPLDLTPMMGDEGYEQAVRAVLDDPGIDAAVVGCVPLTPALETVAVGEFTEASIVSRLARLRAESTKPWVAVVDAGPLYDAMARRLEQSGIPTFRTADRALRLFAEF